MKWEVTGADRQTGADRTEIIDAENEGSARRRGNRAGILVSAVRPLDPDDSVASLPVMGSQQVIARPAPPPIPQQPNTVVYVQQPTYQQYAPPPIQTIQKTGKVWKAQIALSTLGLLVAVVFLVVGAVNSQPGLTAAGLLGSLFFFAWLIIARAGAWWSHG